MHDTFRCRAIRAAAVKTVTAAAVGAAVLFAAGCVSDTDEATPVSSTGAAATSTIAGQQGIDQGGATDIDVTVGDCVTLGGTMSAATIDEAVCGSPESNYRVIAKAEQNTQCPTDADQVYYESLNGTEQGALCLDIDWVLDGCMSIPTGTDDPHRVDCTDPAATNVERVTAILEDTTDVAGCSDGGYTYPERRFTVCTESVTT